MTLFNQVKKIFLITALVGYIGMMLFSIFHVAYMAHSGMPMQDCPFSFGEYSLCSMNIVEHIKVWQELTRSLLPTLHVFTFVGVILTFVSLAYHSPPISRCILYSRRERYKIVSLYQQLFAQGILNPKSP